MHPGPKYSPRWTFQSKMRVRVDSDDGGGDRADEEVAAIMEDVYPVLPEMLLTDECGCEAETELFSGIVGESVV